MSIPGAFLSAAALAYLGEIGQMLQTSSGSILIPCFSSLLVVALVRSLDSKDVYPSHRVYSVVPTIAPKA